MNEIKENVINKNFMITYDFSDNDFGGHIEDAIETWLDKWNSVVSNIKTWLNMRNSLPSNIKSYVDSNSEDMIKSKLEKLEDVTNISKCNEIMIEEKKRIKIIFIIFGIISYIQLICSICYLLDINIISTLM